MSGGYGGAKRMLWFMANCQRCLGEEAPRDPLPEATTATSIDPSRPTSAAVSQLLSSA